MQTFLFFFLAFTRLFTTGLGRTLQPRRADRTAPAKRSKGPTTTYRACVVGDGLLCGTGAASVTVRVARAHTKPLLFTLPIFDGSSVCQASDSQTPLRMSLKTLNSTVLRAAADRLWKCRLCETHRAFRCCVKNATRYDDDDDNNDVGWAIYSDFYFIFARFIGRIIGRYLFSNS